MGEDILPKNRIKSPVQNKVRQPHPATNNRNIYRNLQIIILDNRVSKALRSGVATSLSDNRAAAALECALPPYIQTGCIHIADRGGKRQLHGFDRQYVGHSLHGDPVDNLSIDDRQAAWE